MAEITKTISEDNEKMTLTITFDKNELATAFMSMIAEMMRNADWSSETRLIERELRKALPAVTKEVIYSRKDELADRVVKRASAEVRRKAVKKVLATLGDEIEDEEE